MADTKEYTEQDRQDALDETVSGMSKPYHTPFGWVAHRHPSVDDHRQADFQYTMELFRALQAGIPSEEKMWKMLEEHGVWSKEQDERIEQLRKDIHALVQQLEKRKNNKGAAESIQKRIDELERELSELVAKRTHYANQCAEAYARNHRMSYLVWCCTINPETQKPVWPTFQDFLNERNQQALAPIITKCLSFLNGIPDELLEPSPQGASENESEE